MSLFQDIIALNVIWQIKELMIKDKQAHERQMTKLIVFHIDISRTQDGFGLDVEERQYFIVKMENFYY